MAFMGRSYRWVGGGPCLSKPLVFHHLSSHKPPGLVTLGSQHSNKASSCIMELGGAQVWVHTCWGQPRAAWFGRAWQGTNRREMVLPEGCCQVLLMLWRREHHAGDAPGPKEGAVEGAKGGSDSGSPSGVSEFVHTGSLCPYLWATSLSFPHTPGQPCEHSCAHT